MSPRSGGSDYRDGIRGILFLILLMPQVSLASSRLTLEIGHSFLQANNATLVMTGFMVPAAPLAGEQSYYEFNLGGWNGSRSSAVVGAARGLQWNFDRSYTRASLGVSLISNTSDMLATTFEFYSQFLAGYKFKGSNVSAFYRHWSNAGIKQPNIGMNFLGVQVEREW